MYGRSYLEEIKSNNRLHRILYIFIRTIHRCKFWNLIITLARRSIITNRRLRYFVRSNANDRIIFLWPSIIRDGTAKSSWSPLGLNRNVSIFERLATGLIFFLFYDVSSRFSYLFFIYTICIIEPLFPQCYFQDPRQTLRDL